MTPPVPYSSLNADQRTQVAYLFADDHFGSDVNDYLYALRNGKVTGRWSNHAAEERTTKRVKSYRVDAVRDTHATTEQIAIAQMHMDALAVSVAEKLYQQQQTEEVTT